MSPGLLVIPRDPLGAVSDLTSTLSSAPQTFLTPTASLQASALAQAKRYLDPVANSVSDAQQARLQVSRRKRKRNEREDHLTRNVLRLKQLHLAGFGVDQVWEQARRVIDAGRLEAERAVARAEDAEQRRREVGEQGKVEKKVRFEDASESDEEGEEEGDGMVEDEESLGEDGVDDMSGEDVNSVNGIENDNLDAYDMEDIEAESDGSTEPGGGSRGTFTKDSHGLNDGFFSIDDFNRQTDFLERQDARGDPDDGAASDEEDIDWTVEPGSLPEAYKSAAEDEMEIASSEDEDGPTFGDADLEAPFSSDDDDGGVDLEMGVPDDNPFANTNDIYYKDFFEPPPRPPSKQSKRPLPKTQPPPSSEPADLATDMEQAMAAARRDIFEDDDDDAGSEASDAVAGASLSTHEKRQAGLARQIRDLEAQAVAQREWAMRGEARANDRPLNSLLEEDLEFERTGKPVPLATAEVTSSLEELIKTRILARQFDEVVKRAPGGTGVSQPRRGLADLDAARPEGGLAALYEAEHAQSNDPNYIAPNDAALQRTHAQIARLWTDVAAKLDALCSWHHRPKPPSAEVTVVTAAPRITLEDARPSAVGVAMEESGLAPQEVYRAGAARDKGEVVTTAGTLLGQGELSREDRHRHFRREKEREAKRKGVEAEHGAVQKGAAAAANGEEKKRGKGAREALTKDLKRGGVRVIGKGGELVDVEGKKAGKGHVARGAGNYKL